MKRLLFIITVCFFFSNLIRAHAQQGTVSGSVTNGSTGEALAGVSILVKGTNSGSYTNEKGEYSIKAAGNSTLIFSYVGFQSQEISVNGQGSINVRLTTTSKDLNEIVIVGYGTQKSRDLTAPIVTIKSSEITKQPVSNVANALQGKVAGVIISSDGKPGGAPSMLIRGLGTVNGTAKPLFVVDDVYMDDIGFLSTSDIESVTILKDASSCAIYGVRAANGVVIITTKKGVRNRPMQVNFNAYAGYQKATNLLPMADRNAYLQLTNEKIYASYLRDTVNGSYQPMDASKFAGNTNWMDEVLRGNAWIKNYDMSITGGTEKSTYYFGGSYFAQEGLIKKNDYKRFTLRGAQDITLSKYVKTGYNVTVSGWLENSPADVFGKAYITPPVFAPKNSDGTYFDPVIAGIGTFANPTATLEYFDEVTKNMRSLINVYLDVKPIEGLTLHTSFTPDVKYTFLRNYTPQYRVSSTQKSDVSKLKKEANYNVNYVWDNTATYEKRINEHSLKAMVGFSARHLSGEYLYATTDGVPYYTDATLYYEEMAAIAKNLPYDKVNAMSYFGRLNYSYKDRYLLTATLRRDGSSKFPAANRWASLPSLGLGWIVTKEDFMTNLTWLDYLKLRAGWGQLGNDNVPQNAYTATTVTGGGVSWVPGPYGSTVGEVGYNNLGMPPTPTKWEKTEEFDFGFDANLLHNRLNIVADYYRRETKDAIFLRNYNGTVGQMGLTQWENCATVLNTGIEFSANWNDNITKDLSYKIGGNITTIHNEVLRLAPGIWPIPDGDAYNGKRATYTQEGHPIGEFFVYQVAGVFQNWADVHNYKDKTGKEIMPTAVPGDLKFADINGDGLLDINDKIGVGSYVPKLLYGFNVGLNYKNIDFSADFQGVSGNKIYNQKRVNRFGNENYDVDFYNKSWHGEGTSNIYPSADVAGGGNASPSTFFVESGSYFRIKNVQLGYTLPAYLLKRAGVEKLRVYATAQNLATFFKYNGYTPEIPEGTPTTMGIDKGIYPLSRIINFGVNVNF